MTSTRSTNMIHAPMLHPSLIHGMNKFSGLLVSLWVFLFTITLMLFIFPQVPQASHCCQVIALKNGTTNIGTYNRYNIKNDRVVDFYNRTDGMFILVRDITGLWGIGPNIDFTLHSTKQSCPPWKDSFKGVVYHESVELPNVSVLCI